MPALGHVPIMQEAANGGRSLVNATGYHEPGSSRFVAGFQARFWLRKNGHDLYFEHGGVSLGCV